MNRRLVASLAAMAMPVMLSGCGGGGGGTGAPASDGGVTMNYGNIVTRAATPAPPPVTFTGPGGAITGVAGANFTSIQLNDTSPTLAETQIAYERGYNVRMMLPDGTGDVATPAVQAAYPSSLTWSPNGARLAYNNAFGGLYLAYSDGTHVGKLTTGSDANPCFVSDGQLVFQRYASGVSNIYSILTNGTSLTNLTPSGTNDSSPAASHFYGLIVFTRVGSSGAQLWAMNRDGSGQVNISGTNSGDDHAAWAPASYNIAFSNGGQIYRMNANGANRVQLTTPPASGQSDDRPTWSPDGSQIAFQRTTNATTSQIWVMNADGTNQHNISNNGNDEQAPSWSPFFSKRLFVGAGGELATNAAGFIFGRQGPALKSFLTFDCTTRDSATVTSQTPNATYSPNAVMLIQGDAITNLQFVNGYSAVQTIISGSQPAANGAVVDYDAATGSITDVVPYQGTRAAGGGKPVVQTANGVTTIHGALLGVWDGAGANHAKQGAREVKLDSKTGVVISVK